jgi:hypothetical protein
MTYVQLIEKVFLENAVILTMWDLANKAQLSIEITGGRDHYAIGAVFTLDRQGGTEAQALTPVSKLPNGVQPLIPVPEFPAGHSLMYGQTLRVLVDAEKPAPVQSIVG